MKKITLLTLIAVAIIVISMIGCSSDSTTESNLILGDTTSATFQFMRDSVSEPSFDITGVGMELSFDLLGQQFPSSSSSKLVYNKSASDSTIIIVNNYSYNISTGWHVFDYSATFIDFEDTTTVQGVDSIQTIVNNQPVPIPDSTMNELKIRTQYAFENNNYGSGVGHQSLDLTAVPYFDSLATVTVNGNSNDTLDLQFIEAVDTCNLDLKNSITITNVVFQIDVDEECPESGTIVANQNIALNCVGGGESSLDSLNINGSWTATLTFQGATTNISFTDGTTTWSFTEDCPDTTSAIGSSFSGLSIKNKD